MGFTNKQRIFIEEYLRCWNATEAAKRAGYSEKTAAVIGHENLRKPNIAEAIQKRIDEKIMSTDEILVRFAEQARGIPNEYREPFTGQIDIRKLIADGLGHLIKKDYDNAQGRVLEFYDPQFALDRLARIKGLYKDTLDVTSKGERIGGEPTKEIYDRAVSTLANALGEEISSENGGSNGSMASTK